MKQKFLAAFFVSLSLAVSSQAQESTELGSGPGTLQGPLPAETSADLLREFRPWRVGFLAQSNAYEEPGVMSQKGNLNGVSVVYEKFGDRPRLLGRVSGDLSFGMLNYDGAIQNRDTGEIKPHKTTGTDYLFNLKASAGLPFNIGSRVQALPLVGFGYRYLNDQMRGDAAYEREISYMYLPVGVELRFFLNSRFVMTASYERDVFLNGQVKSHMTQVGYESDLVNTQSKGLGERFALDFVRGLESGREIHITPYLQRWAVEDSDRVTLDGEHGWYEPNNTTVQYGLSVAMGL